MTNRRELAPIGLLMVLWALFFWRILTPIAADQASFKQGDFSGQFVAFGAYQYTRMQNGEIPLWNPYNNSGLPFIADTQAAVFYPPRLLTIALAGISGGWRYHALELEAIAHVLGYTLCLYAFVRRLTDNRLAGCAAAVIGGYGGYLSGYPPLQLALLEAGVWLPLVLLGIHDSTKDGGVRYRPLALTGLALGLSWLAGHPQTSWFLTYLAVGYFAFRCWPIPNRVRTWALGTLWFGLLTFGATAITLLPGIEYLAHTARAGFGYAAKANGFPIHDLIQLLYPGVVSLFSPLYIGVVGIVLAALALLRPKRETWFWAIAALIGLLVSFGGNSAAFPALYNLLPGMRFFRGQERSAYLVANSLAILAGLGVATLPHLLIPQVKLLKQALIAFVGILGVIFAGVSVLWIGFPEQYGAAISPITFSALITAGLLIIGLQVINHPTHNRWQIALVGLLIFELFSVNQDAPSNYDNIPPSEQLSFSAPPAFAPIYADEAPAPVRVDGFRGLMDNYGSLYQIHDARGISPLFLDGLYQLQQPPFAANSAFETNPTFWELNAVRYVFSGWESLPVPSQIVGQTSDRYGAIYLHRLDAPRPFAHMVYRVDVVDSDTFARALLADPDYRPREGVILQQAPTLTLPEDIPTDAQATVSRGDPTGRPYNPESFSVAVATPENGILTLAHPDYPGWQATLDGQPVPILRAYGGFSAVEVPAGEHRLDFRYQPRTFTIGAIISSITWAAFALMAFSSRSIN
ncbi:MAG: YfhO family protein, partial [Phototrophicaceae bacterium]